MNNLDPLAELRDIHLPPAPHWWPPAPGWWLLAVILLLILILLSRLGYKYYRRWRRKRSILNRLTQLQTDFEQNKEATHVLSELSILLRRVALVRFPGQASAGLKGREWLAFLDETGGNGRFVQGPGQILVTGPYTPYTELDQPDALWKLVRDWLRQNA